MFCALVIKVMPSSMAAQRAFRVLPPPINFLKSLSFISLTIIRFKNVISNCMSFFQHTKIGIIRIRSKEKGIFLEDRSQETEVRRFAPSVAIFRRFWHRRSSLETGRRMLPILLGVEGWQGEPCRGRNQSRLSRPLS